MKCPKCRYTSFDFHDVCPRCGRDLAEERGKLNLPPFRPDPPLLIGALIGQSNGSTAEWRLEGQGKRMGIEGSQEQVQPFAAEDSQAIEDMEIAFKGSQALDFELEAVPEDVKGFEPTTEAREMHDDSLRLELDDLQLEDEPPVSVGPVPPQGVPEEPLFPAEELSEAVLENGLSPSAEDLSLEIEDLVIEDLPLEPGMAEGERDLGRDRDRFVDKTVVRPQVHVDTALRPRPGPADERPAPTPPIPAAKIQGTAPVEVFFNLEDIKEDEIAAIRISPPVEEKRPLPKPMDEEPVAAPESSSFVPGRPAVSEELKLEWQEFHRDLAADGEGPGKR